MPDITSAGERRDLSGWNPAREACCLQCPCLSSFRNRITPRQCLTTRHRVARSFRVKQARFSRVIRSYVTRVAKAELQLRINRYDFVYSKFGWGSRLIVGLFFKTIVTGLLIPEGGGGGFLRKVWNQQPLST